MKIVSIREISRHFTKHAELSREGETIHVHRAGKPYVRIVPDHEAPLASAPKVNFAARAREDFGKRPPKIDVVKQIIRTGDHLLRYIFSASALLRLHNRNTYSSPRHQFRPCTGQCV